MATVSIIVIKEEHADAELKTFRLPDVEWIEFIQVTRGDSSIDIEILHPGRQISEFQVAKIPEMNWLGLLGYSFAKGEILLFVRESQFHIQVFNQMIRQIQEGKSIVLTHRAFNPSQLETLYARILNMALRRHDLDASALDTLPFALHRRVIESAAVPELANAPYYLAKSIFSGFDIGTCSLPFQMYNHYDSDADIMKRNYLQAIDYVLRLKGARAGFTDLHRKRDVLDDEHLRKGVGA